jgi:hypothetical protein
VHPRKKSQDIQLKFNGAQQLIDKIKRMSVRFGEMDDLPAGRRKKKTVKDILI